MNTATWIKAGVSVLAVVVLIFVMYVTGFFRVMDGMFQSGGQVQQGTLPVTDNKIDDVPEGEVRFRVNDNVTFAHSYARGDVMLENPKASTYTLSFEFYCLDNDNYDLVYTSPKLKPGEYLQGDKLDVHMKKGTYRCSYFAKAYDSNGTLVGKTQGAFMTITVEK